jgi:hypothetical protein
VFTDRRDTVQLTSRYLAAGHLRHAYALTGHSGQGVTVDRAFVLADGEGRLQEWGYVALSRARTETRLYVTADLRERESHFHDLDDRGAVTHVAQALEASAVESLAVTQRPLVSPPRETRAELERSAPTDGQARLRFIERERSAVLEMRADAERKLRGAEQRLAGLGRFDRSELKRDLRSEVALRGAAICRAGNRLNVLDAQAQAIRNLDGPGDQRELPSSDRNVGVRVPTAVDRQIAEIGVDI